MAWQPEGTVRVNASAELVRPGLTWREVGPLLIAAAGAWTATVVLARGMTGMTGTMGLGSIPARRTSWPS